MKPILPIIAGIALFAAATSCSSDDNNWYDYSEWYKTNDAWYTRMKDSIDASGHNYFTELKPAWNSKCGVLIHYFNDRRLTQNNLSPLETSTVDVKYLGEFYNKVPFDSSYANTADYGDSLYRCRVSDNILGWQVALNAMHVGDSVDVVIPYYMAYGVEGQGTIPPYTALRFHIKLVDIPAYELRNPE